jgi:hypothetical protein
MMIQSSALRKLEEVLTNAITNGDATLSSGPILLQAMNHEALPHHIVDFYELLNKAEDEAKNIRTKPNIDRYLQTIEKLHNHFVVHHLWAVQWQTFSTYINDKGILTTLDALAEFFHSENPSVFLEEDFLGKLSDELSKLLRDIIQSDLSKELKNSLRIHIESLLQAIHKYHIDGTRGLKKAAQALVSDLMMTEHNLQDSDKKSSTYMTIKAWGLSLLLYLTPTPYDIIGAVPDIDGYWRPKFEELSAGYKKIEGIINDGPTLLIQEVVKKSSPIFDKQPQKSLSAGKGTKSLPPSKDEIESNIPDLTNLKVDDPSLE